MLPTLQLQPHEIALFNFAEKLIPRVTDVFETSYREASAMQDYSWMPVVARIEDDPHFKSTMQDNGTMGPTPARQEMKSLPTTLSPDSVTADVTQDFWGEQILISADYLQYADGATQLTTTLLQKVKMFGETPLKRERAEIFNLFANAFTTANGYQTWDGQALCAAAQENQHAPVASGGIAWQNLGTAAFSYAALEAVDLNSSFTVGPDGFGRQFNFDTIITGPALRNQVTTVLKTINEPGGNNNDINLFRNGYRHVIIPDLQDDILANGSAMWFLEDSRQHTLFGKYGKRPRIQIVRAENGRDLAYQLEFDLVANWWNPYGFYGYPGV